MVPTVSFETYSPVTKRYLSENLYADTAFLNIDQEKEVYRKVPSGTDNTKKLICKLNKAIYGLEKVTITWNTAIHVFSYRCIYKAAE